MKDLDSSSKEDEIKNEIIISLEIEEKDINKEIYFLDNTYYIDEKEVKHKNENLKELNDSNCSIFINKNIIPNFQKYFIPKNKGTYKIRIELKIEITNCSYMFYDCYNIINIDLSQFY